MVKRTSYDTGMKEIKLDIKKPLEFFRKRGVSKEVLSNLEKRVRNTKIKKLEDIKEFTKESTYLIPKDYQ